MLTSMTGFACARGEGCGFSWVWDLRSVNSKGLDLRLRVPDWIEGLEAGLRAALGKAVTRGSVSLSLRLSREAGSVGFALNEEMLQAVLTAMARVEDVAGAQHLALGRATAADVLAVRGVFEAGEAEADTEGLLKALMAEVPALLKAFQEARAGEGKALFAVLDRQISEIERLTLASEAAAAARASGQEEALKAAVAKVMGVTDAVEPARLAQELALLAVKTDVTEEIDRLKAHVAQARELIAATKPVGRRLDFLMQEFNREANTLCSKSQSTELTRIGLDLKTVIDQMREQVQNVE